MTRAGGSVEKGVAIAIVGAVVTSMLLLASRPTLFLAIGLSQVGHIAPAILYFRVRRDEPETVRGIVYAATMVAVWNLVGAGLAGVIVVLLYVAWAFLPPGA